MKIMGMKPLQYEIWGFRVKKSPALEMKAANSSKMFPLAYQTIATHSRQQ
jgi:hypothetical protein